MADKKPPREFGGRSPYGLANLRSLQGVVDAPFLATLTPGVRAFKRNGFDEVWKDPEAPPALGLYATEGRYGESEESSVATAPSRFARFRQEPLAIVGGVAGGFVIGGNGTALASSLASGTVTLRRTRDFRTATTEATFPVTMASYGYTTFSVGIDAATALIGTARATRGCETGSAYDVTKQSVLPIALYNNGPAWQFAETVGYDDYDHYTFFVGRLAPKTILMAHAVVARQAVFNASGRPASPATQVPYPLFQRSTDFGETFEQVDMDYLFDGCTLAWADPGPFPTVGESTGGITVVTTMQLLVYGDTIFLAFLVEPDSDPGGRELRIFRGTDLESLVQIANPPDFVLAPGAAFYSAFANLREGLIGFMGLPPDLEDPAALYVSADGGTTWQTRLMPWESRFVGFVFDITPRELAVTVYTELLSAEEPHPAVVLWTSADFGLTWRARNVVSNDPRALGPTDFLDDFTRVLPIATEDGTIAVPHPMAGWINDYRIPR